MRGEQTGVKNFPFSYSTKKMLFLSLLLISCPLLPRTFARFAFRTRRTRRLAFGANSSAHFMRFLPTRQVAVVHFQQPPTRWRHSVQSPHRSPVSLIPLLNQRDKISRYLFLLILPVRQANSINLCKARAPPSFNSPLSFWRAFSLFF